MAGLPRWVKTKERVTEALRWICKFKGSTHLDGVLLEVSVHTLGNRHPNPWEACVVHINSTASLWEMIIFTAWWCQSLLYFYSLSTFPIHHLKIGGARGKGTWWCSRPRSTHLLGSTMTPWLSILILIIEDRWTLPHAYVLESPGKDRYIFYSLFTCS